MSKNKNECRNLYMVDLELDLFYVLAIDHAEALRIVLDREVLDDNDLETISVSIICSENDIVNLKQ